MARGCFVGPPADVRTCGWSSSSCWPLSCLHGGVEQGFTWGEALFVHGKEQASLIEGVIKQRVIDIFISCTLPREDNDRLGCIKMFLNTFGDTTRDGSCKNF